MSDLASLLVRARMQFVSLDRMADGRWEATYRGENQNNMRQVQMEDPVAALTAVLTERRAPATVPAPKKMSDLL